MSIYHRIKSFFSTDDKPEFRPEYAKNVSDLDRSFDRYMIEVQAVIHETKELAQSLRERERHHEH